VYVAGGLCESIRDEPWVTNVGALIAAMLLEAVDRVAITSDVRNAVRSGGSPATTRQRYLDPFKKGLEPVDKPRLDRVFVVTSELCAA